MSKFQTTEELQFDLAVQAAKDAKFRRTFKTKQKLLLYPSDEMCDKHCNLIFYNLDGKRALTYPDGSLEDRYGYTDGIPNEHKDWYEKEEHLEEAEAAAEEPAEDSFEWETFSKVKSQIEDDYDLLIEYAKSIFEDDEYMLDGEEKKILEFLNSMEWFVFRGFVKKEK